jgi:hypothetical protein
MTSDLRVIRTALDIGSTVIKVADLDPAGRIIAQAFHPRDLTIPIARQIESILSEDRERKDIAICSSANGGLKAGVISLTQSFSGAEMRNQILLAGANPAFVHTMEDTTRGHAERLDILLVGGGIDCESPGPLGARLNVLDLTNYHYDAIVYAGNRFLASAFRQRYPSARIIANPISDGLTATKPSVTDLVRHAYLDDLVHKDGISALQKQYSVVVRPTPEIVNRGFMRLVSNHSELAVPGPCVLVDIGGATTDLHYTVDALREDSMEQTSRTASVARYVFTDLGTAASRDSTNLQLKSHPRTHALLTECVSGDVTDIYRGIREGEHELDGTAIAYACLYFALERFARGAGKGLPTADFSRISNVVLTGGGAQDLDEQLADRVVQLATGIGSLKTIVDRRYQIWIDGIIGAAQLGQSNEAPHA